MLTDEIQMKEISNENVKIIVGNINTIIGYEDRIINVISSYYADKFSQISEKANISDIPSEQDIAQNRHAVAAYEELLAGYMLYRYLGISSDEQLIRNEHGKPELSREYVKKQIHFNLAHSGPYVVLAMSERPVGVDIERTDRLNWKVAKRILRPGQIEKLENCNEPPALQREFARYWTQYEAIMKRVGTGFAGSPDEQTMIMYEKRVDFYDINDYVLAVVI